MELLAWAAIALLQVLALPGWLAVRALHLDEDGPLQTALLVVFLSLTLNHALVVLLVLAGAYTRPVLLAAMALEGLLAGLLLWRGRGRSRTPRPALLATLHDDPRLLWPALAALLAIGFLVSRVPVSFAHVFQYWDAIVSWNRWAVDWEAGRLPARVYHYPQLLPTTWSLLYVLEGRPLQFLARGVMSLFPLAVALAFLDVGLRRRRPELLLAATVSTLLMAASLGRHIGAGLADLPVAALALLAFYPLYTRDFEPGAPGDRSRLAAAGLLAVGCALTKQAGLYVAAVLPAFAAGRLRPWPLRRRAAAVGALALLLVAGIGPWYAYGEVLIARGIEVNEIPILTQKMFGGATLAERGLRALALWQHLLTPPLLWTAALLVLASLWHRPTRWITVGVSLPFSLLWALWFSYDARNEALALPFLGWSIAAGAWVVYGALGARRMRVAAAAWAAVSLTWIVLWADPQAIALAQQQQLVELGKPALNRRLLAYQREHGFEGRILSNYRYLTSFETLRDAWFVDRNAKGDAFWPFRDGLDHFVQVVRDPANDIRYVLVSGNIDEDIKRYLRARVSSRDYEVVFQVSGGRLLRIVRR